MSKIPTAEEFFYPNVHKSRLRNTGISKKGCEELMIKFAKLHVEAALKEASEKAEIQEDYYSDDNFSLSDLKELADNGYPRTDNYGEIYAVDIVSINKDSILNAYPVKLIK